MKYDQKIGFIGAGNMATALIKGLMESGLYGKDRLSASDVDKPSLKKATERFGIECYSSNAELVRRCSTVLFSVKPQNIREVLEEVKGDFRDDHLLISIAAGIPRKMIHSIIGPTVPLIRVMPNTPALIQKGVSALAGGEGVTAEHMAIAIKIFHAVGETVEVEESAMDGVTALSGSGPGYIFKIMEHMVEAGAAVGLDEVTSKLLVVQTFLGASYLAKESELSLSRLREMVTSPGGTTAAGLASFDEMGLEEIIKKAVKAAHARSVELGKEL